MKTMHAVRWVSSLLCMAFAVMFCLEVNSYAVSANDINKGVEIAIKALREKKGPCEVLDKAKGVLVFPGVFKGAIGLGGEYGYFSVRSCPRGREVWDHGS